MKPIKYETALLLREKMLSHNFSIYGDYAYCLNDNLLVRYIQNNTFAAVDENIFYEDNDKNYFMPAPFQEEVIEWLWDEHKIHIQLEIHTKNDNTCYLEVLIITFKDGDGGLGFYSTKEYPLSSRYEAIEEGIVEALKLIKNK